MTNPPTPAKQSSRAPRGRSSAMPTPGPPINGGGVTHAMLFQERS